MSRTSLHPLFHTVGGRAALTAVVDRFYELVRDDALLAPLFAATDMAALRAHQIEFLSAALGGPAPYRGPSLQKAHHGRGITKEHFHRVAGHLQTALLDARVEPPVLHAIMTTVAALLPEVVG